MDGLVDVTAYLAVQFPPSLPSSTHSISFAYVVFPPSFRPLSAVFPFHVIDVLLSFLSQQQKLEPTNFLLYSDFLLRLMGGTRCIIRPDQNHSCSTCTLLITIFALRLSSSIVIVILIIIVVVSPDRFPFLFSIIAVVIAAAAAAAIDESTEASNN